MEIFSVKNLSFTYPQMQEKALDNVNFTVKRGEFCVVCGQSGCGKTTLLRLAKAAGELLTVQKREKYFSVPKILKNAVKKIRLLKLAMWFAKSRKRCWFHLSEGMD